MNMLNKTWLATTLVVFGPGLQAEVAVPTVPPAEVTSVTSPVQPLAAVQSPEAVVLKSPVQPLVGLGMGGSKAIVAAELNLYGLLRLVVANIDNMSKQLMLESAPNVERQTMLGAAFQLANESIKLFAAIVEGFNKGGFYYNPELKYRFITVCNAIDIQSPIEPCDLRGLSSQVKTFCRQVKAYSNSHKGFLSKEDCELSDKIINLGNALTSGLLRDEFFDIDWADRLVDWTVHRPAEFVADNKELVITLGIVSIAALGWWYYEKKNGINVGSTPPQPPQPTPLPQPQPPLQGAQPPAAAVVGLENGDGWFLPTTTNNCWLNASSQCLFRIRGINDINTRERQVQVGNLFAGQDPAGQNCALVMRGWGNVLSNLHPPVTDPTPFHHVVRNAYFPGQGHHVQQDASEFITNFFGDMRDRMGINPFTMPLHYIRVHGQCPECHVAAVRREVRVDQVNTLGVQIPPIANRNPTLEDCLRNYFAPVANMYGHPTCGHRSQATEQPQLGEYPRTLVVSLGRFEHRPVLDGQGHQVMQTATDARTGVQRQVPAVALAKIQTPVAIPLAFDLATCCGDHHPEGDGQYDLVGMVLHGGRVLEGGHYVALARAQAQDGTGTWHYFSDQETALVNNIQEVLAEGIFHDRDNLYRWWVDRQDGRRYDPVPYVLFYQRRNPPAPVQPPAVVTPPVAPPQVPPATQPAHTSGTASATTSSSTAAHAATGSSSAAAVMGKRPASAAAATASAVKPPAPAATQPSASSAASTAATAATVTAAKPAAVTASSSTPATPTSAATPTTGNHAA
jgi:ubiquitin C-terminal hydrolase